MKYITGWIIVVLAVGLLFTGLSVSSKTNPEPGISPARQDTATFAGGCFWCMEGPFDKLEGVHATTSGYTGGHVADPSYREVSSGNTGHAEAVQIVYDSTVISYSKLLEIFWRNIDPTQANGQFCDIGSQYRSAIFYHNKRQQRLAAKTKQDLSQSNRFDDPIVTAIEPMGEFYVAEDYHQNFYKTHPTRYKQYRQACGRDRRLEELWGSDQTSGLFQ